MFLLNRLTLASLCVIGMSQAVMAAGTNVDAIFYGGPIITMDQRLPSPQAVAIKDGRIQAVGSLATLKKSTDEHTQLINLQGKTLLPGFIEPHAHILATALTEHVMLNLSNFTLPYDSLDTIVAKLKKQKDDLPTDSWIVAFGVDPARTTPFMSELNADILDRVSRSNPIFVMNQSGHLAYANHKAMEIAGITDATPNPPGGGVYVKDADGHLTGVLDDSSTFFPFFKKIPLASQEVIMQALKETGQQVVSVGVTTSTDMSTGVFMGVEKESQLFKELTHNGVLPFRMRSYLWAPVFPQSTTGFTPNMGDDVYKIIGVKIISDGSNQGLTGSMMAPYLFPEHTTNEGNLNYTNAEFLSLAKPRFEEGWQISTHANGDRAIAQTLDVYSQLVKTPADKKTRLRIEHFTVATPEEIDQAKKVGASASFTIGHTDYWGKAFIELLGPERGNDTDPSASLLKKGVLFSYHSDSPVSPIGPLVYVSEGSSRLYQAEPQKVLNPEEKISVYEALKAVTINPAYQLKMEKDAGSISKGKFADLVVVDKNPLTTEPYEVRNIKVKETWVGGKRVYLAN